jgi:hypothetical protein
MKLFLLLPILLTGCSAMFGGDDFVFEAPQGFEGGFVVIEDAGADNSAIISNEGVAVVKSLTVFQQWLRYYVKYPDGSRIEQNSSESDPHAIRLRGAISSSFLVNGMKVEGFFFFIGDQSDAEEFRRKNALSTLGLDDLGSANE